MTEGSDVSFDIPVHFNSHAHVERDFTSLSDGVDDLISTHTLTWSVTITVIAFRTITLISTHTLTWSVTKETSTKDDSKHISTHTLTWSVTEGSTELSNLYTFQLTRSRGA